ncbi:DNA replication/repair protein RecF [Chamaesiphon sp. VAR_69_metabat_338]|uniref:DNA replication/repair protein RecF n=2 Tax=Chamaesiphon sp. VAR_69_metabat_338 TaxID=2964704 RepID=UPI00286E5BD5|nr:DNA replication/repair protein RecF [Chamaesiphon sp. VAR_69_metabat_338]
MYLNRLHLRHFRNYREQEVIFSAPKTILLGDNAQGKSNLLEAVELLSTLKSHRVTRDRDLVLTGETESKITAQLTRRHGSIDLNLLLRDKGRRTATVNHEILKRQLDFLGILNAVEFSALDLDLVRGNPEMRRHWIDSLLFQIEPVYAHILHEYQRILKQRNSLLKQAEHRNLDPAELASWNHQLIVAGTKVIRRRMRIIDRLAPIARAWHTKISKQTEALTITYAPNIITTDNTAEATYQAFTERLELRQVAEQSLGMTLVGPHRDEIELTINDTPAKAYGSQGQQRTLVLALKLAELELIEQIVGEPPLLLLDDVLAELDLTRQNQLLSVIEDRFQTLITTTHLGAFDAKWLESSQILQVRSGEIIQT